MNVEDPHGDEDGEGDEEHAEEEVLAEQGHGQGCRRNDLGKKQEEHCQREENRNAERDLVRRNVLRYHFHKGRFLGLNLRPEY